MNILAGTSGYSYKAWKGAFYPEKMPAAQMLGFYAERLPTVEINNTFYRMPKINVMESWAEQVPDKFRFSIKAPRSITHLKRLKEAKEETGELLCTVQILDQHLGVILFQLPPYLRKDLARLESFLELLPDWARAAFEFRHVSWFEDDVFDSLRSHNCTLCIADTDDDVETPLVATADWGYLRLRRISYSDCTLDDWVKRVRAEKWDTAFVFFKHEDEGVGPKLATEFLNKAADN